MATEGNVSERKGMYNNAGERIILMRMTNNAGERITTQGIADKTYNKTGERIKTQGKV